MKSAVEVEEFSFDFQAVKPLNGNIPFFYPALCKIRASNTGKIETEVSFRRRG